MEIVRTKPASVPFKDIGVGSLFRFMDKFFLRVEELSDSGIRLGPRSTVNCIRLEDFSTDYFDESTLVFPVKSKLVVEE